MIFSLFILCVYFVLPKICVFVLVATAGINNVSKILSFYSFTLMFINSSLNPFVYCWKMRHIRNAIRATKRNLRRRACNSRSGNLYFVAFSWEREGVPTQEMVDRCQDNRAKLELDTQKYSKKLVVEKENFSREVYERKLNVHEIGICL